MPRSLHCVLHDPSIEPTKWKESESEEWEADAHDSDGTRDTCCSSNETGEDASKYLIHDVDVAGSSDDCRTCIYRYVPDISASRGRHRL